MPYFMTLVKIFVMYFKIGLFNFGGGLAATPLLQRELEKNGFMNAHEFFDVLSISQMTPGAIGMNTATFVGNKVAGIPGAIVATTALALPSIIVILVLSHFLKKIENNLYKKAIFFVLKSLTTALILYAGYLIANVTWMVNDSLEIKSVLISILMFIVAYKVRFNPIFLILSSGVLGFVGFYIF